jgi:hypothetical protein
MICRLLQDKFHSLWHFNWSWHTIKFRHVWRNRTCSSIHKIQDRNLSSYSRRFTILYNIKKKNPVSFWSLCRFSVNKECYFLTFCFVPNQILTQPQVADTSSMSLTPFTGWHALLMHVFTVGVYRQLVVWMFGRLRTHRRKFAYRVSRLYRPLR